MNQNNHMKVAMSFLIFFVIGIKDVGADIITSSVTISSTPILNYSGENATTAGTVIGSNWPGTSPATTIFSCVRIGCSLAYTYINPLKAPLPGISATVDGVSYDIYPSGVSGIGYILGVKDLDGTSYVPASYPRAEVRPGPGVPLPTSRTVGAEMRISFVTTGQPLVSGQYTIPSQTIANFSGYYLPNFITESIPVLISGVTINAISQGCKVSSGNNSKIDMQTVLGSDFPNIGSTVNGGSTTITLSCNGNVKLYEVMTDSTTPANRTDILSLTSGSTAKGVGFQLIQEPSSTAIKYGPDSAEEGTTNQFFVSNTTGEGQIINLPIKAQYIRTGNITAGSANAVATVTFSYQ